VILPPLVFPDYGHWLLTIFQYDPQTFSDESLFPFLQKIFTFFSLSSRSSGRVGSCKAQPSCCQKGNSIFRKAGTDSTSRAKFYFQSTSIPAKSVYCCRGELSNVRIGYKRRLLECLNLKRLHKFTVVNYSCRIGASLEKKLLAF